jgi:hypothetical protein
MAVGGEEPDTLFFNLYRDENFGGYAFVAETDHDPVPSIDGLPVSSGRAGVRLNRTKGKPALRTTLPIDKLEKRLTKIFRENRTIEEEQGLSTLYLAVGFLKWFDSSQSEEPSLER